jgi:hypothetical protein
MSETPLSDTPVTGPLPVHGPEEFPLLAELYPPSEWESVPFSKPVAVAAVVSGLVGAAVLPLDRPAVGWLLVALVMGLAAAWASRKTERPLSFARVAWALAALALLAVGAFRASVWLFDLCVAGAFVAGSLAVVGPRTARGALYDVFAVPIEAVRRLPWLDHGVRSLVKTRGARSKRLSVSALATVVLLAVFLPLLSAADADFANLLDTLKPDVSLGSFVRWAFVAAVVGLLVAGALYSLESPPPRAEVTEAPHRTLDVSEWGLPVLALVVLFGVFIAVQLTALFGGDGYVRGTAGVTYADYARHGFWQLTAITVLTLGVIVIVLRFASKRTPAARWWLRAALGSLTFLTLLIVASALDRMWTYQQAYGFTVLRLLVEVCEGWLGAVYLLVAFALVRLDQSWVTRAAIGAAVASLLALAVLNPERFIADRNVDRAEQGRSIDLAYLRGLSADAVPAVLRLPTREQSCVLPSLVRLYGYDDWSEWNLSRADARETPVNRVSCEP